MVQQISQESFWTLSMFKKNHSFIAKRNRYPVITGIIRCVEWFRSSNVYHLKTGWDQNSITDPEMSLLNRQSFAWGAYSHLFQQHLFFNHMIKAGSSAKVLLQPKTNVGSDRVRNAEPQSEFFEVVTCCYPRSWVNMDCCSTTACSCCSPPCSSAFSRATCCYLVRYYLVVTP